MSMYFHRGKINNHTLNFDITSCHPKRWSNCYPLSMITKRNKKQTKNQSWEIEELKTLVYEAQKISYLYFSFSFTLSLSLSKRKKEGIDTKQKWNTHRELIRVSSRTKKRKETTNFRFRAIRRKTEMKNSIDNNTEKKKFGTTRVKLWHRPRGNLASRVSKERLARAKREPSLEGWRRTANREPHRTSPRARTMPHTTARRPEPRAESPRGEALPSRSAAQRSHTGRISHGQICTAEEIAWVTSHPFPPLHPTRRLPYPNPTAPPSAPHHPSPFTQYTLHRTTFVCVRGRSV